MADPDVPPDAPPNRVLSRHEHAPASALAVVDAGLDAHNLAAAPLHQVRPLACLLHDAKGQVLGGAVGRTWGACAELQQLWVAPAQRGQGLATQLMAAFEAEAAARGCQMFYLETWSFQALGFYQRLGYREGLRVEGFGPGLVKHWLTKRLTPDPR